MSKKICFFFVLILFGFILQISANDSQWYLLGSGSTVTKYVNVQQISYEPETDTARFWTKDIFPDGDEHLQQAVRFSNRPTTPYSRDLTG